jgi:DnaA family protein
VAAAGGAPIYVPLSRLEQLAPAMLEGLEDLDLVCIDDVGKITGQAEWEQALFHLYNRARDGELRLVLAADSAPANLALDLPDLQSRLQSGVVFQLHELTDSERSQLLKERAGRLGIELPDAVVNYVLQRHSRSTGALVSLLQELDSQSLALKRRITVPLVKEVMGW